MDFLDLTYFPSRAIICSFGFEWILRCDMWDEIPLNFARAISPLPLHYHGPFFETTMKNKHKGTRRAGNLNHIEFEASRFADVDLTTGPKRNYLLLTFS